MTIRTVTIDTPIWVRETFTMDIPDDIEPEDVRVFIDDLIDAGAAPDFPSEEGDTVLGMDRQFSVDGEDV